MNLRLLVCSTLLAVSFARAQSPDTTGPLHNELRQLKTTYETALSSGDLTPLESLFDAHSSGVTVDNQSFHTFAELKAIYDNFHAKFPGAVYRIKLDAEPSLIAGDFAIAHGTAEEFVKTSAAEFTYPSTWTAVLRHTDTGWKLVRSQVTMDPFNNSIVTFFEKKAKITYGIAGLIFGVAVGLLVALGLKKRPHAI